MKNAVQGPVWPHLKFGPLLLARALQHFSTSLGLVPGEARVPHRDILVHLFGNIPTEQRMLRTMLGDVGFRSFKNWVTGRHRPVASQMDALAKLLGQSPQEAATYLGMAKNGELMPSGLDFLETLYKFAADGYAGMTGDSPKCPCCDEPIWIPAEQWWAKVAQLTPEQARFADFPLRACAFVRQLLISLNRRQEKGETSMPGFSEVYAGERHPMHDWLHMVSEAYGADSLAELYRLLPYQEAGDLKLERLMKYSSGDALPTYERVQQMIAGVANQDELKRWFTITLHLCLAMDFVQAASPVPLDRARVRKLVKHRTRELAGDLEVAIRVKNGAKLTILGGDQREGAGAP